MSLKPIPGAPAGAPTPAFPGAQTVDQAAPTPLSRMSDLSEFDVRSIIKRIEWAMMHVRSWHARTHLDDALMLLKDGLKSETRK